ncbi:inositol monophosphatase, partial [bacterium]
ENDNNRNYFISFFHAPQASRRPGSASLDLCYVAAGRLDGFWELKLHPWDMSAGSIIAQKAGASVTDFHGNPWILESDRIVAANPQIHKQIMTILKGHEA